jgi:hypothetical protein
MLLMCLKAAIDSRETGKTTRHSQSILFLSWHSYEIYIHRSGNNNNNINNNKIKYIFYKFFTNLIEIH